jgi:glutaredoxin-related protein
MYTYLIYARDGCGFCTKLLKIMKERNEKFIYILCYNVDDSLKEIMERYNWRTVPIVLQLKEGERDGGELIGGCDDTIMHLKRRDSGEGTVRTS